MESDWEEYTPTVGEPYSPGTEWYYDEKGWWCGLEAGEVHCSINDTLRYRRPKQSTTVSEVQQLKEAVKQIAAIVLELQKSANSAISDNEWFTVQGERELEQIISNLS